MEELKPAEILKAVQTCGNSFCTTDHHECPYGDDGCIDCVDRLEADFEALIDAGDDLIIRRAAPENKPDNAGLHVKYDVRKVSDGSVVNNCFVLRPDRDPAAIAALRAYADATPNKTLAEDIYKWVGRAPENKVLTLDQLRQMDGDRVWTQFRGLGMYGLVAYHSDPDGDDGDDIYITNNLGGRSTFEEILSQGGTVYASKPEGSEK